ncbi:hypothetical protein V6N12_050811 [Hibiscus sabdariffa]|uniref:Uncharacterized protein n=1 Tax=Hibiscus sabdariffa TaxID=183260 RepID=A0ABR2GDG9_9ROSI
MRLVKSTIVHFQDCLQMEMENAYLQLCVQECLQLEKGNAFYAFQFNMRLVKSTIVHFQGTITLMFDYGLMAVVHSNSPFLYMHARATDPVTIYCEARIDDEF